MNASLPLWPLVSAKPLPVLHVLSDLHLESGPYALPADLKFDILVAAGDIGPVEISVPWLVSLNVPVVYVLGNHERWKKDFVGAVTLAKELAQGTQVHVLERDEVTIQGVRFLGATLWTNLREFSDDTAEAVGRLMRDYQYIDARQWLQSADNGAELQAQCEKFEVWALSATEEKAHGPEPVRLHLMMPYIEHHRTIAWLRERLDGYTGQGPTVVVTHHAPSFESLLHNGMPAWALNVARWSYKDSTPARIAGYASNVLSGSLKDAVSEVDLWIHGHTHSAFEFSEQGVRVVCNPRGHHIAPLTEESIAAYALLGHTLTLEDVARSQAYAKEHPYAGDANGFDARRLVSLETGLSEALFHFTTPYSKSLGQLHVELEELMPAAGREDEVVRRCVNECFQTRLTRIRKTIELVQSHYEQELGIEHWQARATQLQPPTNAYLREPFEADLPLAREEFQAAIDRVELLRTWMDNLHQVGRASLQKWARQAASVLKYLSGQGVLAKVLLPGARALNSMQKHFEVVLVLDGPEICRDRLVPPSLRAQREATRDESSFPRQQWSTVLNTVLNSATLPRTHFVRLEDGPVTGPTIALPALLPYTVSDTKTFGRTPIPS